VFNKSSPGAVFQKYEYEKKKKPNQGIQNGGKEKKGQEKGRKSWSVSGCNVKEKENMWWTGGGPVEGDLRTRESTPEVKKGKKEEVGGERGETRQESGLLEERSVLRNVKWLQWLRKGKVNIVVEKGGVGESYQGNYRGTN